MAKKDKDSHIFAILLGIVALIYVIPVGVTFLLYKSFSNIPGGARGRAKCLVSMILASLTLFASATCIAWIFKLDIIDHVMNKPPELWTAAVSLALLSIPFLTIFWIGRHQARGESSSSEEYYSILFNLLDNKIVLSESGIETIRSFIEKARLSQPFIGEVNQIIFYEKLAQVVHNFKVTTKEIKDINLLAKQLEVGHEDSDNAEHYLNRVRQINQIINGKAQGVATPSNYIIKKGESCYFCEKSSLYENVTENAFLGASIKLGEILPLGSILSPRAYIGKRLNYDNLKMVDNGLLVITDKKVVFTGNKITREFLFNKIIGIDIAEDSIQINRSGKGRKEIFKMDSENTAIALGLIARLLSYE